jgi:GDSL-like lipase/acylhydrolase family protein
VSVQHVVLLGDSIFDNAAYVGGGPDVVRQVRELIPGGWQASLAARDGAVIAEIPAQMSKLPADASHLVVSIGGNDALKLSLVLYEAATSMTAALERFAALREEFQQSYRAMLKDVLARNIPTAACTIYEPRYPDKRYRRIAATGLCLLNDAITHEAFRAGVTLIDLRLICDSDDDFANPIEPSSRGGAKIAAAIAAFAQGRGPSSAVIAKA